MNAPIRTMTRRKQNAPKRLNSCDPQPTSERTPDQTVDTQDVDSDSGSEAEEEEEDETAEGKVSEEVVDSRESEDCSMTPETAATTRHSIPCNETQDRIPPVISSKFVKEEKEQRAEDVPEQKGKDDDEEEENRGTNTNSGFGRETEASNVKYRYKRQSVVEEARVESEESTGQVRSKRSRNISSQANSVEVESWPDTQTGPSTWGGRSSTSRTGNLSEVSSNKYKYSSKLSPTGAPQSTAVPTSFDRQMALVMSSMPLALLAKGRKDMDTRLAYLSSASGMSSPTSEDQPLDLSKKTDRGELQLEGGVGGDQDFFRGDRLRPKPSTSLSPLSTPSSSSILANGFSSLQSLQQRFGGEFSVRNSQTSGSSVIPLQPSLPPNAASLSAEHGALRASTAHRFKSHGNSQSVDWLDSQEKRTQERSSSSPSSKQERKSRPQTASPMVSPVEDMSPAVEGSSSVGESMGSKHTIHRCSCHKTFGSLYGLSVHLQETGHTPSASRSTSLMDYPKLVRGQDMWLNQESEQTRRILRCMQCGESFKSLPLLTVHMMQTQHYTKIVSSEHGRRTHKCSTYCDREMDKECIFKCKVCHETFTDMEGLANHMIVSGHHKKQSSSRHVPVTPSQATLSEVSSLAKHGGKRKRFLRDDVAAVAAEMVSGSSPVPSLLDSASAVLDCSRRHGKIPGFNANVLSDEALSNGFHIDSFSSAISPRKSLPGSTQLDKGGKTIVCDSCGKRFDAPIFDAHVLACLRQRAEVIDALKSKLAVEEALLSRSESKLLRSGFTLSSASSSTDAVGSLHEDRPSLKSELDLRHEPENFLIEGPSGVARIHAISAEPQTVSSMEKSIRSSPKGSTVTSSSESELAISRAKVCDLKEVPLKKWYSSKREVNSPVSSAHSATVYGGSDSPPSPPDDNHKSEDSEWKSTRDGAKDKMDMESQDTGRKRKLSSAGSPCSSNSDDSNVAKFKAHDEGDRPISREDSTKSRPHTDADIAADFTSSALHKLDMFSRGLKLSPPRRAALSPEGPKRQHSSSNNKTGKRKETSGPNRPPANRRDSRASKSPMAAPISPISLSKSEGSPEPQRDAAFDILDPNMGSEENTSSSAIEAMESFIHKSFSAKSDLRSSSLATMFSPFRTCFPLPGSLSGHVTADPADPALSCFAKFSKFFRMVPGAPLVPDTSSSRFNDQTLTGSPFGLSSSGVRPKTSLNVEKYDSNKSLSAKQVNSNLSNPFKSHTAKPFHPKHSKGFPVKNSSKSSDPITPAKRYKYSSLNPEEVAKHMSQGGQYPNTRCGSIVTATPLAACGNTAGKKDSQDSPHAGSALPSTSELEKMKSELKRKRKFSSSKDESPDTKLGESVHGDDELKGMLRPSSKSSKNEHNASQHHKEQAKSGKPPCEVNERESVSTRVYSNRSLATIKDDAKDKINETNNEVQCDEEPAHSSGENIKTVKRCETKGNLSSCEDQEDLQAHAKERCERESCKQHETGGHDTSIENGDSNSHESFLGPMVKLFSRGEPQSTNKISKRRPEHDEVETCSKKVKGDNETNTQRQQMANFSQLISECNKTECRSEDLACNDAQHIACSPDQPSHSLSVENSGRKIPLPHDEGNQRDEEDTKTEKFVTEMVPEEAVHRSMSGKSKTSSDRNEEEFTFAISSKSSLSQSPPRSPDQSLHAVGDKRISWDITQLEANKDLFQSTQSSASSSPSSSPTREDTLKKQPGVEENSRPTAKRSKSSALDSLSCFVYSQTLTSEHPLDSLQKLLSTNDLPSGSQAHNKSFNSSSFAPKPCSAPSHPTYPVTPTPPASTSRPTPESSPLNLTVSTDSGSSRTQTVGELVNRPGDTSRIDDPGESEGEEGGEEEGQPASVGAAEDGEELSESGCASDGETAVYKCAACNRQFASKGSYRYHLSRCHLSSVKKLGIKDAFNMSPYVYLPLDHTAKFSKYYQMAHELANKGK